MADFLTAAAATLPTWLFVTTLTTFSVYVVWSEARVRNERARHAKELTDEELKRFALQLEHSRYRADAATRRGQETAKRHGRLRVVDGGQ